MPTAATLTADDRLRDPATFTPTEKRLNDKLARVSKMADDLRALVEECLTVRESLYVSLYGEFQAECILTDLRSSPRDLTILHDTIDGTIIAR